MAASDRNSEELGPRVPPSGGTQKCSFRPSGVFLPTCPHPGTQTRRESLGNGFLFCSQRLGALRVGSSMGSRVWEQQDSGGGGRLGPRSPFRTFCSFLNISLFQCLLLLQQDPSCHQLLVGPAESDQSPCLAGLPSLTRTNIDLGDPGKLHSALSNYLIAEASALNLLGSGVSPPYFTSSPGLTGP